MKTIYKKYCNDIQNPALGAYLIYVFSKTFYQEKGVCLNLLDIFIFIPLIMVRDIRDLVFWFDDNNKSHQITKISKLYEKIGYIGKSKDNFTLGTINGVILKFREFVMASIIFAIESNLIKVNSNGIVQTKDINLLNKELNDELMILTKTTNILAKIYAKDSDINKVLKNLEVIL